MNFFGYPIEIWLASFVAVMFKLKNTGKQNIIGSITTVVIAMFSGLILYGPVSDIAGLSPSWNVIVAIAIAITSENLMKSFSTMTLDPDFIKDWLLYILSRKTDYKRKDIEKTIKTKSPEPIEEMDDSIDDSIKDDGGEKCDFIA